METAYRDQMNGFTYFVRCSFAGCDLYMYSGLEAAKTAVV